MRRLASNRRFLALFLTFLLLALALALSALAPSSVRAGPLVPDPVTDQAKKIDDLYEIIFYISVVIFVLVEAAIVFMVFRYRKRDESVPPQTHGSLPLEIVWTAIPVVIVGVLFALSWKTLDEVQADPKPDLTVDVQGFQWQWRFTYPEQGINVIGTPNNIPEMVLPVGQNVRLNLASNDVIHSFYVPQFLYKLDVVPGRLNSFTVRLDEEGLFDGQCAEFCGLDHAAMTFRVRGVSRPEFEAWVAEQSASASTPGAQPNAPVTTLELAARALEFDKASLQVKAGEPFAIRLDNQDIGIPHNIAIYTDKSAAKSLFTGGLFVGAETRTNTVPALQAGAYFFRCDAHPTQMTGNLSVR